MLVIISEKCLCEGVLPLVVLCMYVRKGKREIDCCEHTFTMMCMISGTLEWAAHKWIALQWSVCICHHMRVFVQRVDVSMWYWYDLYIASVHGNTNWELIRNEHIAYCIYYTGDFLFTFEVEMARQRRLRILNLSRTDWMIFNTHQSISNILSIFQRNE